jgi:mono/diheme cytochrome c family protein
MVRHQLRSLTPLLILILFTLAGCSLASDPIPAGPIETGPLPGEAAPDTVPIILPSTSSGAAIFEARCASCHGATGKGDGEFAAQLIEQDVTLPDFSDPTFAQQHPPQEWYTTITVGTMMNGGMMPPWRSQLTDAERWDVTYYLYTLSMSEGQLERGAEVFNANCASCHGENGDQDGILTDIGRIAALSPAQIRTFLRGGDANHQFDALDDGDLTAAALFARTFAYDATPAEVTQVEPTVEPTGEAAQPAPGDTLTVSGQVVLPNGQIVPPGTSVTLTGVAMDPATSEIMTFLEKTVETSSDGTYTFEGVPLDQAGAYIVSAKYNGVEFNNGAMIPADQTMLDLPITVYEATSDESVLTVDSANFLIREHPDALLVVGVISFSNSSESVFLSEQEVRAGQRGSVAIALPPGAQNVQFNDGALGGRFVEVNGTIYDTEPVLPGSQSHQIVMQYVLPITGAQREFTLPLPYGAQRVTVFTPTDSAVRSEQLTAAGTENFEEGGEIYNQYLGESIAPGGTLTLRIGPANILASLSGSVLPLLAGLAALLIVGGAVVWWMRRGSVVIPDTLDAMPSGAASLIRQIADLDNAYDEGAINRLDYEARRSALKAQVAEELQASG